MQMSTLNKNNNLTTTEKHQKTPTITTRMLIKIPIIIINK